MKSLAKEHYLKFSTLCYFKGNPPLEQRHSPPLRPDLAVQATVEGKEDHHLPHYFLASLIVEGNIEKV